MSHGSSPPIASAMKRSLLTTKVSSSSMHDSAYVKSDDVDASIVLDVTVVSDRLTLKVNCAANQSGATCTCTCTVRQQPIASTVELTSEACLPFIKH